MIPVILALLAAALGLLAGAPWWILLAAMPAAIPWRLPPVISALAIVALLPWQAGPGWLDLACVTAGVLAAWAALHRLARVVPWVALPYLIGFVFALGIFWPFLPPEGYWVDADVAVRARILVLAAIAVVASAVNYLPRYRNVRDPAELFAEGPPVLPQRGNQR